MNKVAFLFPGQGCQHIGMGKTFYEDYEIARKTFEEASDILNIDFKKLCFQGSLLELNKIENMFPAIFVTCTAISRVFVEQTGVMADIVAGHSLGEYSALTCSGSITFEDTLKIIKKRSILAQEIFNSGIGAMTVVNGVNIDLAEKVCKAVSNDQQVVVVACHNSDEQVVISGHRQRVMEAEDILIGSGAQITPMLMSAPLHSPLMHEAAIQLADELRKYKYKEFDIPVLSNISGKKYNGPEEIGEKLTSQMVQTVKWRLSMDSLKDMGVKLVIEMGPQATLTNLLIKDPNWDAEFYTFGQKNDRNSLIDKFQSGTQGLKNKNINGEVNNYKFIEQALAIAICTKNSNWNNAEYQKGVIEQYEKVQKMYLSLKKEGVQPRIEHQVGALEMLQSVFETKKVPKDVQKARFFQLIDETGTRDLLVGRWEK